MNISALEALDIRTFPLVNGINMAALLNSEVGATPFIFIVGRQAYKVLYRARLDRVLCTEMHKHGLSSKPPHDTFQIVELCRHA
jgi:hypothetical protein